MKAFSGWRFVAFELDETNRRLLRNKRLIRLQPKSFDTLIILLRKAGQLVGRKELFEAVWPDAEVEDANLTNNIATLRKILGTTSIRAVPKFGYQFCIPVVEVRLLADEACAALQEGQARMALRTVQSVQEARNLFWLAIAYQSDCATAWAWLGRASRFLEKFGVERVYHRELGTISFRRAFTMDPDCGAAHQFYTTVQTDRGEGLDAR